MSSLQSGGALLAGLFAPSKAAVNASVPDLGDWTPLVQAVIAETGVLLNTSRDTWSVGNAPTALASLDRPEDAEEIRLSIRVPDGQDPLLAAEAIIHEVAHFKQLEDTSVPLEKLADLLSDDSAEEECYRLSIAWVKKYAPEKVAEYAKCVLAFLSEVTEDAELTREYRTAEDS